MSNYSDYSQRSEGYGILTKAQAGQVKDKKQEIDSNKSQMTTYVGTIKQINTGKDDLGGILSSALQAKQDASASKDLTPAQKKILSNVQTNIETLKKEVKTFEKGELRALEKDLAKTESRFKKDIQKMEDSSKKVDTLAQKPGWGRSNFIFGTSKQARVDSASAKAAESNDTRKSADIRVTALKGKAEETSKKIEAFQTESRTLSTILKNRMDVAKDVHNAILDAKDQRAKLLDKYDNKKQELAHSKDKLHDQTKRTMKIQLGRLDKQIESLENLEKKLGNEPLNLKKNGESKLLKDASTDIKDAKKGIEDIYSSSLITIRYAKTTPMGLGERVFHTVAHFFSSDTKGKEPEELEFGRGDIAFLQSKYPGFSLEEAIELAAKESSGQDVAVFALEEQGHEVIRNQSGLLPDEPPVLTGGPPEDLPPVLPEEDLAPENMPPPTDEPPVFTGGPPTDLPPQLEEELLMPSAQLEKEQAIQEKPVEQETVKQVRPSLRLNPALQARRAQQQKFNAIRLNPKSPDSENKS